MVAPVMHQPAGNYQVSLKLCVYGDVKCVHTHVQTIFRARFSAITEKEITRAMVTLVE